MSDTRKKRSPAQRQKDYVISREYCWQQYYRWKVMGNPRMATHWEKKATATDALLLG